MADIELLDKVIATIEANPAGWNQDTWRCETGMCVAGWVGEYRGRWIVPLYLLAAAPNSIAEFVHADAGTTNPVKLFPDGPDDSYVRVPVEAERVSDFARRHLGLSYDQGEALFHYGNTLEDIKSFRDQLAANPDAELILREDYDDDEDVW